MFKRKEIGIVDVVGISLIVTALISAGGIYYLTTSYVNINDTWNSCSAVIMDVNVTMETTNEITFQITLIVNNPSKLDIEIISPNVEYNVYAFEAEPKYHLMSYDDWLDHFITPGRGVIEGNRTIHAGSSEELRLRTLIREDPRLYWEHFQNAMTDGQVYLYIEGFALYYISDFPSEHKKFWLGYADTLPVNNAEP